MMKQLKRMSKYLFFLLLLASLAFVYGFSNQKNSQKTISDVVVEFESEENNFLSQAMVNKLLIQNNRQVKNQAKSVIDLHELERTVLSNPYIEEATLFLTIDGQLKSTIKQREPIVRILSETGDYYLDKQGVKVPLSTEYAARVPLLTGLKKEQGLKTVYPLMKIIAGDDFLKKEIVGVHQLSSGDYVFTVRSGSYKIQFGKLVNMQQKIQKLKAFYSKTFADKTIEKYKTINLKYHNQVVAVK